MRLLVIFAGLACAASGQITNPKPIQMTNPKPVGTGSSPNGNRFFRYIGLPNNRATAMACNTEQAVSDGTQLTITHSDDSCWYDLKVAANTEVSVSCSVFILDCNDNDWAYWSNEGYETFCGNADPTKTFAAVDYEAYIFIFYDVWAFSNTGQLTCSITGKSTSGGGGGGGDGGSGGGGDGGSGGGGGSDSTECGVSGSAESGRIVEGGTANNKEYPWQVYIYSDSGACGATIINNQWLLTAAHCVPKPGTGQITACIGTNNYNNCKKTISSTKILAHSGYTFDNTGQVYPHDIALAKLSETLTFDDTIKPVCLPSGASDKPAIGTDIEIAGWGDLDNQGNNPQDLKKAWMKVIADGDCISDSAFKLVCLDTSGSNKSPNGRACSGDSGGYGGAKNSEGKAVQYGVASFVQFNNGCLEPNAYTDVAYHMDWINQQIAAN